MSQQETQHLYRHEGFRLPVVVRIVFSDEIVSKIRCGLGETNEHDFRIQLGMIDKHPLRGIFEILLIRHMCYLEKQTPPERVAVDQMGLFNCLDCSYWTDPATAIQTLYNYTTSTPKSQVGS